MAELSLKQIVDRLNAEFTGDTRKLVFWYDDKAEFEEDMESVELENAKVYRLQPDNQFQTKYYLERIDTTTNFLIYAPFPKPDVKENHLEDTMLYSKRFYADRASLLSVDLGIDEKYKYVIEKDWKKIKNNHFTPNIAVIKHIGLDKILLIGEKNCLINKKAFKEIKKIDFSKTLYENQKMLNIDIELLLILFYDGFIKVKCDEKIYYK